MARALGDAVRLREEARGRWGWTWIDRLGQDLRYAARMLWRSPGFTLTAVVMLAIGIGANIAAFGFLNMIVLRPLPVRDPGHAAAIRAPRARAVRDGPALYRDGVCPGTREDALGGAGLQRQPTDASKARTGPSARIS